MIKSFTITNIHNESIKLELEHPERSGFVVQEVTGIGPVKANVNISKSATSNGGRFNSSRKEERNIVFSLKFYQTGKESIEDIRHKSYKYFDAFNEITIEIETDKRVVTTKGYVETNEPTIFSKDEGCIISVLCPDPFFYSKTPKTTVFYGVDPLFEFPFENELLTDPLLEMSEIKNKNEEVVYYDGDATVGLNIVMHAVGVVENITIYNSSTRELMSIEITMSDGDTIFLNTSPGEKSITLLQNGVRNNILNSIKRGSKWFTLTKGDNIFAFTAEEGSANLQFMMENKIAYDGV